MAESLPVHSWPAARERIAGLPAFGEAPLVISVATPDTQQRDQARTLIRAAVSDALGLLFDLPAASIRLDAVPGRPLRADAGGRMLSVSISHEAGLSVAALSPVGQVGIDIMRLPEDFSWEPVARDYLDPDAFHRIAHAPPPERMHAFAVEWTRLEAGLKCVGTGLAERSPALQARLAQCAMRRLDLPSGYAGMLAYMPESLNRFAAKPA